MFTPKTITVKSREEVKVNDRDLVRDNDNAYFNRDKEIIFRGRKKDENKSFNRQRSSD